jgi:hypothetical protein
MALYEELREFDVIPKVMEMGLSMDWDGRVVVERPYPDLRTGWIEAKICQDRRCGIWLYTFFAHFQLIPTHCMGCWKIVYIPKSLKELFWINKLQEESDFDLPSKCGLELREITGRVGGYEAFWYNPLGCSLDEARENTERVKKLLGRKAVILKRGCTEMEFRTQRMFGFGSDEWGKMINERSSALQAVLEDTFVPNYPRVRTPAKLHAHIKRKWIEHAMKHARLTGDYTYREFIESSSDLVKVVNYAGSIHRSKDYELDYPRHCDAQDGSTCGSEAEPVCKLEAIE